MKKITLLVGVVFASLIGTAQTISTFPYNEDLESMPTGTALANGWTNTATAGTGNEWIIDINGTGSSNTGPTANGGADHNPGIAGGQYAYVETSGTNAANVADMLSPYFNMTALTNAKFSFWYHAYGATMGDLTVDARIGSQGVWANIGGPITGDVDVWQEMNICVGTTYMGNDSIQFRFSYTGATSFRADMAIDDITVFESLPLTDIGVTAISAAGGCGLTATELFDFTICNFGDSLLPGTVVPVSFTINGGVAAIENITLTNGLGSVCNNGCLDFTTTLTFDLSAPGSYILNGRTMMTGDAVVLNDAASGTVNNILFGGAIPYFENFDGLTTDWVIDNVTNGSWELGTPAGGVINSAASGINSFATNLTGLYNASENSNVTSPCIDISTATGTEVVTMKVWWSSENSWDGANLFTSNDAGTTWSQVGAVGDPMNWYNDNSISGAPNGSGDGWTGTGNNGSSGWVAVEHRLDSTMMVDNSSLLLRVGFGSDGGVSGDGFAFDDVAIGNTSIAYEYGVTGIDSVMGICNSSYTLDAGTGYSFYHWSDLNNNFNGTWANAQTIDVTASGTYVITVADAAGMIATDTVFVELLDFTVPVLTDVVSCVVGDSAMFDAGSGTTPANIVYTWSTGDTTQISWLLATGTVSVTKTDTALGCTASDTAIFTDSPIFTLGADMAICEGDTAILNTGISGLYLWSDGTSNPTLSADTAGTYSVTVTDAGGCTGSDTLVLSVNTSPTVDLGVDDLFCIGNNTTLDAGTATSYLWNDGSTNQTLIPAATGNYIVTITDANGCTATDTVVIILSACVGVDEFSNGTEVKMFPNPTQGNLTIKLAEFNNDVVMNILTIYGQVVRSERITSNTTVLDLNDLSEGTYMLQLKTKDSTTVNKFIINR